MIDLSWKLKNVQITNQEDLLKVLILIRVYLTLGKCLSILADRKVQAYVPFRDSKLTRILK
jgi:hypothetical protein